MISLISLDIELSAIRSFLQNVADMADSEYMRIMALTEAGKFSDYDDESNAYFFPMMWEKLAIRATLGELNALIEWELGQLANNPLFAKRTSSKGRAKMVFDLRLDEIIELIEQHHKIDFCDFKDYEKIRLIRSQVNSFKHRKGYKDPRKDACDVFGDEFEVGRQEAFQCIVSVKSFFKEIRIRTKPKTSMRQAGLNTQLAEDR